MSLAPCSHTCVDRPNLPCVACEYPGIATWRSFYSPSRPSRSPREHQRPKNVPWCPSSYLEEAQRFLEMAYSDALPIMRVPCGLTADLEYHVDTGRKVVTLLNPQMLSQHPLPLQAHILRERAFEQCGYKVEIRGTSIQ
jgi:hypothetical protein